MTEPKQHSGVEKAMDVARDARADASSDAGKSSYASYLFGSSGTDERPAWSDSPQGRFAIRMFSRGVMGGLFFTLGGHIARKQLAEYESFAELKKPFRLFGGLSAEGKPEAGNALQYVARGWDKTVGRAIEEITYAVTPGDAAKKAAAAWEVTNFRTKTFNGVRDPITGHVATTHKDRWGFEHNLNGRSLGAEVVTVTFDFFMMSIGDAMTRNIVQALDPNVKQPWYLDKHGQPTTRDKGRFDFGKWTESLGRSTWRVVSKNAGEDWGAALPYVYQMKWQRQAIAKWRPGFKLTSDHGWNGGLATVAAADKPELGITKGQVVGGYQAPGALDLQIRFVGYNWYTLMYREGYDALSRMFDKMRHGGVNIHLPQHFNPLEAVLDGTGFMARYVTKSFIKANLYMQPAVIPFWLMRTPQTKWRGGFAVDELATANQGSRASALLTLAPHGAATGGLAHDPIFLENVAHDLFPRAQLINAKPRPDTAYYGIGQAIKASEMAPGTKNIFNIQHPYEYGGVKRTWFDHLLNPFGALCYHSGSGVTQLVDRLLPEGDGFSKALFGKHLGVKDLRLEREKFLRNYVDAAFAYTPYMWAKAETGLRVDDRRSVEELGHMDRAIYRLIDSTFSFNFRDAGRAAKDVWTLAINYEKDVTSREGLGAGQQPVGDGTVVPQVPKEGPHSKINAATISHTRQQPASPDAPRADDGHKQWAETVAGRKLDAHYQSAQPTLH